MTNFRLLVRDSKLSLKDISEATGIGYSTLGNYNQGSRIPNAKNAQILADYFGVSIPYLLGLDDNPVLVNPGSAKKILEYISKGNERVEKEINDLILELNRIQISKRELLEQYLALDTQEKDILHKIKEVSNER